MRQPVEVHTWLYVRYNPRTKKWYTGRTGHSDYHMRKADELGKFAIGMDGKELVIQVPTSDAHWHESEAIQFLRAFVGKRNNVNRQQTLTPVTGFETSDL